MKKFFAIAFVAAFLVACEEKKADTTAPAADSATTAPAADTTAPAADTTAVAAPADSAK